MATLEWVSVTRGDVVPDNAVEAGNRDNGRQKLYVARAMKENEMTPGYFASGGSCLIPWGGIEWDIEDFEVLTCDKPEFLLWITAADGQVTVGGVGAGWRENTDLFFCVGRAEHDNQLIPGKIVPNHNCCYVGSGNREHVKKNYESLTVKAVLPHPE